MKNCLKASLGSLISIFVVHCLDSRILPSLESRISILKVVSVDEEAGLNLSWSDLPKTDFCMGCLISLSASPLHTGKCIRRFVGIYAYCRYFIDRKW